MTLKERLIEELSEVPDALIVKVIDFLHALKNQQLEDYEDIADANAALATIETEGTISWEELKVEIGV
ncbi:MULTISPECIES: hypothetical protein [Pseudanabaena]|jgi:hypothetical protein|uniref:hypothetical protein n=1 Tax=Pseudanabaena TaxID=1152 RepID=UPI00247A6975|nr:MULTISPECIES: hypothetical protein [Pseudanabaena]MEA5485706.1 hypothetical protein [Pseudanabaena sp. CCNP1317]WGS72051.1 hypothetical protein OA858_20450 [Pseudanabaena galeata CCNP1313]